MKCLQNIMLTGIILGSAGCSRPPSYQASMAANNLGHAPNPAPSSCGETPMGPLTYEQMFPAPRKISQFVRRIHEDKSGNFWFGTNGDGVVRYNGDSLKYLSINEGFPGVAVRGIVEDKDGNIWLGTENGLAKYSPIKPGSFTHYGEKDGLVHRDIWSLVIDSKGIIWIGTLAGVSHFDGKSFTDFELPETEADSFRGVTSSRIVHSIMEDSKGRMWFGTNGGAFIYDGTSLSNISVEDGLCHNAVNDILEARDGSFWFATHHNGLCRWNGESFTHYGKEHAVEGTEVWSLYEDSRGHIWFPSEGYGIYRFDGEDFVRYHMEKGLSSNALQCIFEDGQGRIWCGGHRGLYRLEGNRFFSVSQDGPWQDGC